MINADEPTSRSAVTALRRPPVRQSTLVRSNAGHTFDVFVRTIGRWWPADPFSAGKDRVRDITIEQRQGGRVYETWDDGTQVDWGELLTNTLRHAEATRAAVTVSYVPGYITVSIADSGPRRDGLPPGPNGSLSVRPGSVLAGSGLGLAGIAERVSSCGGNLTLGPTPAGGFAVTARLPTL